jgi:photosystem II stability/assembly factor-like uncharacterized protein
MNRHFLLAAVANIFNKKDRPGLIGVFRRDAAGDRWSHVLEGIDVFSLRIHPRDPQVVVAGTADGVWRSTDGGASFRRSAFPGERTQVWSFLFDAGEAGRILAGCAPLSLYESRDDGASWKRLPDPVLPPALDMPFEVRVTRLAERPGTTGELYASLEVRGVMRSTDAGETWTDCSADLMRLPVEEPRLRSRVVSDHDAEGMLDVHALATSPADPDGVTIAARTGLFRSGDQGRTWQDLRIDRFSRFTYSHDLRVSRHDPATLYACMSIEALSRDGGLYRSRDAGRSWLRYDRVSPGGTLNAVCENPSRADEVHFATRYAQVFSTHDDGETWRHTPLPEGTRHVYDLACG